MGMGGEGYGRGDGDGRGRRAHPIHGKIVPNAVLPPFRLFISSLIRIRLEPVIDIAEYHGVARGIHERAVYELRIWLFLVERILFTLVLQHRHFIQGS